MLHARFQRALSAALIVAAALLGALPASAAVYSGHWDPGFAGIFPQLGWKGSATFILPDACVGMSGSFANAASPCGGGGMQVQNAKLQFYNSATDPLGLNILQTMDLGSNVHVNGMSFVTLAGATQLTGVDTGFFDPAKGGVPVAKFNGNDYYFDLILHDNLAALYYTKNANDSPGCGTPAFGAVDPSLCGFSATPATIVFTAAIPEPSTYALLLVGLAALGSMRRTVRKRI